MAADAAAPDVLPGLLDHAVERYGANRALDFLGRSWTYRELGALVRRATLGLQRLGVRPGDRVGLCLPNTPYYPIFFFAALKAGATVVNFNPLYVERELRHQIGDSGAEVMVVLDLEATYRRVATIAPGLLKRLVVCPMTGILPPAKALLFRAFKRRELAAVPKDALHIRYDELMAGDGEPAAAPVRPDDVAVLQYTGGTTGVPKGAMLTHANLVANCRQVAAHWPGARPGQERALAVLPFFHVFAMTTVLNYGVAIAAEIVLLPRFELGAMLAAVKRRRVTVLNAVPTIYTAVNAKAQQQRLSLDSLSFSVSGGAPLPPEVRERFVALTGCKLVEGYGLTEASPVVTCNPIEGAQKPGSAGVAMVGTTIEIRDLESGALLPPGGKGEICVRGPQVMRGYWGRPEETAAVFAEGALRTGDVGWVDDEGYLFIVDRLKDLILCGGYNVYPRVIEDALYEHPAVLEATVIGVPDAYRGQAPKAFVVLRPGMAATAEELRLHLAQCVSKIEMPREIELRDALPKTMVGKLSKKELIAEAQRQPDQA